MGVGTLAPGSPGRGARPVEFQRLHGVQALGQALGVRGTGRASRPITLRRFMIVAKVQSLVQ